MYRIKLVFVFFFISGYLQAQTAPPADVATIKQNLKKLGVLGSVLYIAAHPDDENTRLLAYLARQKHYRTGYLSLTRGDGGQNLIGSEQGELLGLIRTQELLAARRVDGAEQFFTRANDFGFSKNPEETLKIWDKEKVLGDVVWVIRKFRPDVMICRFPTTGEGGHGHHTSSAILAEEAFKAAADPKRFPEQLKYVQPWQAKRLLWNTFSFSGVNTTAPDQFKIDVGVYNPLLGKGYGEIAAESRSNHRTQGFGTARQRGQTFEYFKTILGDAPKTDLMDGVNTTWGRVAAGTAIVDELAAVNKNFNDNEPQASVMALVNLLSKVELTIATDKALQNVRLTADAAANYEYWHKLKSEELKELVAACAGLWFEAYANEPSYAVGDSMNVRLQVLRRLNVPIKFTSFSKSLNDVYVLKNDDLGLNQPQNIDLKIGADRISQPYWLESPHGIGMYAINDGLKVGSPENPDGARVYFDFDIAGKSVQFERKLMFKYTDPARGELYQPVEITPPVTANITDKVYVFNMQQPQTLQVKLKAFTIANGSISIKPVEGWKISPEQVAYTNKHKGDEWTAQFTVSPINKQSQVSTLNVMVDANGKSFSQGIQRINYEHIPNITLFPPAQTRLVNIELKTAGKRIGYIAGAGDLVADALRQVGYDVHMLTENEIMSGDLSGYNAIVVGVRAYNTDKRLVYEQPKLMEYVKNGGNLLVQYNTFSGLVTNQIGPYPFRVVNERVTDENAVVTITDPNNQILNYPNKITHEDFKGWIQERGLYFVSDVDPKYQTPLLMNDAGESPKNGSLIVADYGKGRFIYTSLVFFRELPAGVPGAYRLFVNLLSKP